MNPKTRLIVTVVAFLAAGVYVTFISEPARKKQVTKLQSATTNEVVSALGKPFTIMEGTNFTRLASEMAKEGFPISNADMAARGTVWLYPDGGIKNSDLRFYQTVFFDESNRVYAIYRTGWMRDSWRSEK